MNKTKLTLMLINISLPLFMYSMMPNKQLLQAADTGNVKQAEEALNAGANANGMSHLGFTPLHYAVEKGHLTVVKFLLSKGAAIECKTFIGSTPLCRAVEYDQLEIARLLLNAGALVDAQESVLQRNTSLHYAVTRGNITMLKLLLEYGANKDLKDACGKTALDLARDSNNQEMIKLLNEVPPLKSLSARAITSLTAQNQLTLEQVKNSLPVDFHDIVQINNFKK